ncbi:MAG: hypothetical protein CL875_06690 [Dehalococcoidales bacterium]|jgi:ribosomal protein S27AE|nr:hypothetical protein [Dehalococcoidales bacterium]
MLNLKICPRCKGGVVLDRDHWGWYEQCIQCGYLHDLPNIAEVELSLAQEAKRKVSGLRKRGKG